MAAELTALLASAAPAHRKAVAATLGLAPAATAGDLAVALNEPGKIVAIIGGLSPAARRLAARAAFMGELAVAQGWSGRPSLAGIELERHGLAFAFTSDYLTEYLVPRDVQPRLADGLAAAYAGGLAAGAAERWLEAPLQLAHDVAALWAYLARSPARVKTDGALYQREVPKLLDALPPAELHGFGDALEGPRLGFALAALREEGLVRLRVHDRPGSDARRELVTAGDPLGLLGAGPAELRTRSLRHACHSELGAPGLALANGLAPGAEVSLASFGAALRALCADHGWAIQSSSDVAVAVAGLHYPWLAGAVALGLDSHGVPAAVRPQPAPVAGEGRFVCQSNFELIALSPPTPLERLVVGLTCEPVPHQAHVFRLTRATVCAAQRSGVLDGGVIGALERLAGDLPQNVARSVEDWSASVRRPLRLRTAMMLDTGDAATADTLLTDALAPLVVERLGPALLAVAADDVPSVDKALRRMGHSLDPWVERVSGQISERERVRIEAEDVWAPQTADAALGGKQISTLGVAPVSTLGTPPVSPAPAPWASPGRGDEPGPVQAVLEAIEAGTDLLIVYAGARGTTSRRITPYDVEGGAVSAYCHLRNDERSFWLHSIQDALVLS